MLYKKPTMEKKITGTQIQCTSLLVGLRWLSPYSSKRLCIVRMRKVNLVMTASRRTNVWKIKDLSNVESVVESVETNALINVLPDFSLYHLFLTLSPSTRGRHTFLNLFRSKTIL